MGFLDTFTIAGNIKQTMLPFVLNNKSGLNVSPTDSSSSSDSDEAAKSIKNGTASHQRILTGAQHFSFRNEKISKYSPAGFGRLQVVPSSMMLPEFGNLINKDISMKLLYPNKNGEVSSDKFSIDDIFNAIPGVQIREFLPDTRLDQLLNFFGSMIETAKDVFKGDDAQAEGPKKTFKAGNFTDMSKWKEFFNILYKYTLKGMFSNDPNSTGIKWDNLSNGGNILGIYDKPDHAFNLNRFILTFPYQLYYRLQSCTTTNIYTVPGMLGDKTMYSSQGSAGWNGGVSLGIMNQAIENIPVLGKIAKTMLGNMQIHYMPWWDPESGSGTKPPQVQLTLHLFNDTAKAAMMNFIFVNTIVPNNMWIQYGMFQHASDLYDIKIEGYNRLFACSGDFNVKQVGVLRDPTKNWVKQLVYKYGNRNAAKSGMGGNINLDKFYSAILANKLIKIPDVYEVSMTFQSLLPLNFNNYLYTYSQNNNIQTTYMGNDNIWQNSAFSDLVDPIIKGVSKAIKEGMETFKSEDEQSSNAPTMGQQIKNGGTSTSAASAAATFNTSSASNQTSTQSTGLNKVGQKVSALMTR